MKIQVLVAAMNQKDHSLLDRLNIQSDAIIGNQCDFDSIEQFTWKNHEICYLNFNEKGVGQNRNNALIRANCDVCLFADDDMMYLDGYPEIIEKMFSDYSDADVIIFNIIEDSNKGQNRYIIRRPMRVNWFNFLRYGMVRVACRHRSIKENGIYFNQCFGGGCEYQCGEDCIFLSECLRKGLKVYALPVNIAKLTEERESTWNKGFTDKFFHDQGKLYRAISRKWWRILCFQDAVRHQKTYNSNWYRTLKIMIGAGKQRV